MPSTLKKIFADSEQLEVERPAKKIPQAALYLVMLIWGTVLGSAAFAFWALLYTGGQDEGYTGTKTETSEWHQSELYPSAEDEPASSSDDYTTGTTDMHGYRSCSTSDCKKLRWLVSLSVSTRNDPCEDFHAYACGGAYSYLINPQTSLTDWLYSAASKYQPAPVISASYMDWARMNLAEAVQKSLQRVHVPSAKQNAVQKAAALFKSCLTRENYKGDNAKVLRWFIDERGIQFNGKRCFVPLDVIVRCLVKDLVPLMFAFVERVKQQRVTQALVASRMFLSWTKERAHLMKQDNYLDHVKRVIAVSGTYSAATTYDLSVKIQAIEGKVMKIFAKRSTRGREMMKAPLSEFGFWANVTDHGKGWIEYLKKHTDNKLPRNVTVYFRRNIADQFHRVLKELEVEELKTYVTWETVRTLTHVAGIVNYTNDLNKELHCMEVTTLHLPNPILAPYFSSFINDSRINEVKSVIRNIKERIEASITASSWLDKGTRAAALEKMKKMEIRTPSEGLRSLSGMDASYSEFPDFQDPYLSSWLEYSRIRAKRLVSDVISTNIITSHVQDVTDLASITNFLERNAVSLSPGSMMAPSFAYGAPHEFNYGWFGSSLTEVIMRGYDDHGKNYDFRGQWANWWSNESYKAFSGHVDCIKRTVRRAMGIQSHRLSSADYLADNLARKSLYEAYSRVKDASVVRLNGTGAFTRDQLFFISTCLQHCGMQKHWYNAARPTLQMRCNVPLMNSREFSVAFNCPLGSRMNPEGKCVVW